MDLYTAYFDPRRCFKETLEGTFRVIVAGGWFPRQLLGRCTAFCAYVRCLLAALTLSRCVTGLLDVAVQPRSVTCAALPQEPL